MMHAHADEDIYIYIYIYVYTHTYRSRTWRVCKVDVTHHGNISCADLMSPKRTVSRHAPNRVVLELRHLYSRLCPRLMVDHYCIGLLFDLTVI